LSADVRIDEILSIRGNHLWIDGCDTVRLAEEFGTPVFVVSETQLRQNYRRIKSAFEKFWTCGAVQVLPSIKANYTLALRRILVAEGAGCDTFGEGELMAALRAGTPGDLISVNGSAKSARLIESAIVLGARITLDSEREFELVVTTARRLGRRARVRLRLRPEYPDLLEPSDFIPSLCIRDAAQLYKPGIELHLARDLGLRAANTPQIELTGLMAHLGRHSARPETWVKMARSFGQAVTGLSRDWGSWRPLELDIGGGFPAPRDPTSPARKSAPPLEAFAQSSAEALRDSLDEGGVDSRNITLQIEPGRAIFANAGVHLARVCNIKSQQRPAAHTWIEVDTTEMFLPDSVFERAQFIPVFASQAARREEMTAHIVGISCNYDIIAQSVRAPQVCVGDIVAFLDTGAYQDAAASNFNLLPRPATILVQGDRARLVKRSETLEELFSRDLPVEERV
jgi:diaminopimelate decarboxylase